MSYLRQIKRKYVRQTTPNRWKRKNVHIEEIPYIPIEVLAKTGNAPAGFIEENSEWLPKKERVTYTYWVLEESYRDGNKVTSRIVHKFGTEKPSRKEVQEASKTR